MYKFKVSTEFWILNQENDGDGSSKGGFGGRVKVD